MLNFTSADLLGRHYRDQGSLSLSIVPSLLITQVLRQQSFPVKSTGGTFLSTITRPDLFTDAACGVKLFANGCPGPGNDNDHGEQPQQGRNEHAKFSVCPLAPTQTREGNTGVRGSDGCSAEFGDIGPSLTMACQTSLFDDRRS